MKIYISGMITSLKEDQYRRDFNEAANYITERGHEAVDPSLLGKPEHHSWDYYMRKAIAQLVECDAIYMLRSYHVSKGALLEKALAIGLEMPVFYEQAAEDIPKRLSTPQLLNEDLDTGNYGQQQL